ncbi:MAG: hypothetical protein ACI3XR_05870, partial [Eubacteriales bacterium]
MNLSIEKEIVSRFIIDRKKERVLYELSNTQKRENCIFIFDRYIREECMEVIDKHQASPEQILALMKSKGAGEKEMCYILSINDSIDETKMPLREAIEKAVYTGCTLVYCTDSRIAFWE